ncbi:MAG: T9SS type A sorting domain-containing protein [Ignavibacteria bacterium]|nr:T9SS type A sorting domain-containing protein [Ignavibacteria bacterium]
MRTKIFSVTITFIMLANTLHSQSIIHPWHVIDRGGGKATAGGVTLQASIGQPAIQAMSATSTILESGYIPGMRSLLGTTLTIQFNAEENWNMVSVPLSVVDYNKNIIYPTATSNAFSYNNSGYTVETVLRNGVGYWVKFPSATTVAISGTSMVQETVNVSANWNMIGVPSGPALVSDVSPIGTTIVSNYFGFSANGYFIEDTLKPGRAYWVKVNQSGKLAVKSSSVLSEPKASLFADRKRKSLSPFTLTGVNTPVDELSQLHIRDAKRRERILYFSSTKTDFDLSRYDLPPVPPEGVFDVRYATHRMIEVSDKEHPKDIPILISSAEYPITILWQMKSPSVGSAVLVDGAVLSMIGSGEMRVPRSSSHVSLRLSPAPDADLPTRFDLSQNYPNPFNPTTTIKYSLPNDAIVALKIYDVLGREVQTLVDRIEEAGYKSVEWDAATVASGVYFYRIEATSILDASQVFTETRKMALLR